MAAEPIDVVFTFDTTGSMYPCLTQVRRSIKDTVKRLFRDIPGLRVGVLAHGDYCDAGHPYVTKALDLTHDEKKVSDFVEKVEPTGGGDSPECYELVLHEARSFSWKSGRSKVICLIGDDVPHPPTYPENKKRIDWKNELGLLLEAGINVYGVHAMPGTRGHSKHFYTTIAKETNGLYLTLDQFNAVNDLIMAVCYKQEGPARLQEFEKEVKAKGRMNRAVDAMFATLLGREKASDFKATDLTAVPAGRFQVLDVDADTPIKEFVESQGASFKKGRGFYQFTKTETIQDYKEVVLQDKFTGDLFSGKRARELLELPEHGSTRIKPAKLDKYIIFVQSTSVNRKLIGGTKFLYEVEDWERV
ncbi:conserved hypothetical protein [Virus Rctr197k]|nr:conserved hypothetical protein [Virus Rctr197k]